MLIHGLWVTPSWEKWVERYQGRGYRVLAPAYPGFEVEVEALNEDPSPIEAVTIPPVVEHLQGIVGELERAPIIMGHSAGGFFTDGGINMSAAVCTADIHIFRDSNGHAYCDPYSHD